MRRLIEKSLGILLGLIIFMALVSILGLLVGGSVIGLLGVIFGLPAAFPLSTTFVVVVLVCILYLNRSSLKKNRDR